MAPQPDDLKKPVESEAGPCDTDLFQLLRQERKSLANAANVPPYVVFSDKTLTQMATFFPQSDENLLWLHGVGEVKLEKYGRQFLDLICSYCREHRIADRVPVGNGPSKSN